jgi:light-regulated signal transduction histidine kinase (bacteriophytochrome)
MAFDASSLRHELRTPVNHVLGYADLLLEEEGLDPNLNNDLAAVRDLGQRVLPMIAGLLDADDDVSRATIDALSSVVDQLRGRVASIHSDPAHASDLDRIAAACERLAQLVDALRDATTAAEPAHAATAAAKPADARRPTVLVVDDDEANGTSSSRRLFASATASLRPTTGAKPSISSAAPLSTSSSWT